MSLSLSLSSHLGENVLHFYSFMFIFCNCYQPLLRPKKSVKAFEWLVALRLAIKTCDQTDAYMSSTHTEWPSEEYEPQREGKEASKKAMYSMYLTASETRNQQDQ